MSQCLKGDTFKESIVFFQKVYFPTFLFFGSIGNVLIVATVKKEADCPQVFCHHTICRTVFFLKALAIADALALWTRIFPHWLAIQVRLDLATMSGLLCKLFHRYISFTVGDHAIWIVCCISLDRFMLVAFPVKSKYIMSMKLAVGVWFVTALLAAVKNVHFLIGYDLVDQSSSNNNSRECSQDNMISSPVYTIWVNHYFNLLSMISVALLPILIVVSTNLGIYFVWRGRSMKESEPQSTNEPLKITWAISISFVACISPYFIHIVVRDFTVSSEPCMHAVHALLHEIFTAIFLLNHVINFVLYVAVSPSKRRSYLRRFCRCFSSAIVHPITLPMHERSI